MQVVIESVPEHRDAQAFWDATARTMLSRRAYRRYHGPHKSSVTLQDWGTVAMLIMLWGFYAITAGDITDSTLPGGVSDPVDVRDAEDDELLEGNRSGLTISFVWAYTDQNRTFGALAIFLLVLIITYLIVRYQTRLDLKGSAWITFVTILLMLGMAIDTGTEENFKDKNILERQTLMSFWTIVQVMAIGFGVIRKVVVPWMAKRQMLSPPKLQQAQLQEGVASQGLDELWQRVPNLQERIAADHAANGTPLYSFTGEYRNPSFLCFGARAPESVAYVGGLDENGAAHGIGAWHDTHDEGELFVGRFMNGSPVAPYRARTNKSSAFLSITMTIYSCRSDSVTSTGSLNAVWGKQAVRGGRDPVPLKKGSAYVECNTSGIFYKGFPHVVWLREPRPLPAPNAAQQPEPDTDVRMSFPDDSSRMHALHASLQSSSDKREPQWVPQLMQQGSRLLQKQHTSQWQQQLASSSVNPVTSTALEEVPGGFEALFFVHGFNCGIDNAISMVGQLLALGSFPPHIKPFIFAWPCTGGPFYPFGHVVCQSDYLSSKMVEALHHLKQDGCRRVHLFGHSMGARVVAAAADKLAEFFPKFAHGATSAASTPRDMHLASVTFLSPDMDTGEFVGHCGPIYRSLCPLVTIYGDTRDSALDISVLSNSFIFKWYPDVAPAGLKEETEKLGISISACLGQHCNTLTTSRGEVLDVDYIATTHLSSNVHGMRHNYFHLNREMIDDIRDTMVTLKRAADRPYRLEWTAQNTYGFVVAPNYLVA